MIIEIYEIENGRAMTRFDTKSFSELMWVLLIDRHIDPIMNNYKIVVDGSVIWKDGKFIDIFFAIKYVEGNAILTNERDQIMNGTYHDKM